jgi:hypothetical protein
MRMVGDARVATHSAADGLRVTLGVGKEAPLRRELTRMSGFIGRTFAFDWLGDEVVMGIADRSEVTHAARGFASKHLEPPTNDQPRGDEWESMFVLPAYLVVGVRNSVGAALALGALRKLANDTVPDMFRFRDAGKHRGISVVELASTNRGFMREGLSLSYALCPKAIVFSLSRPVLDRLIDEHLDGKAPRGGDLGQRLLLRALQPFAFADIAKHHDGTGDFAVLNDRRAGVLDCYTAAIFAPEQLVFIVMHFTVAQCCVYRAAGIGIGRTVSVAVVMKIVDAFADHIGRSPAQQLDRRPIDEGRAAFGIQTIDTFAYALQNQLLLLLQLQPRVLRLPVRYVVTAHRMLASGDGFNYRKL